MKHYLKKTPLLVFILFTGILLAFEQQDTIQTNSLKDTTQTDSLSTVLQTHR